MNFNSLEFLIFVYLLVFLLNIEKFNNFRNSILFLANTYFLFSFGDNLFSFLPLLLFVFFGYLLIFSASKRIYPLNNYSCLGSLVVIFIWLKSYFAVDFLPSIYFPYITVGLSYILFRIIHLYIDVSQNTIKFPGFFSYVNYIFSFLTFVSGPIQRYEDYINQIKKSKSIISNCEFYGGVNRCLVGFFMVTVICNYTSFGLLKSQKYLYASNNLSFNLSHLFFFVLTTLIYVLHLYINFAGYMHICIGIGRLIGISIPENFNQPFKSKNLLDLWTRWHITLSDWFKIYLFNPLMKLISKKLVKFKMLNKNIRYFSIIPYFFTFFIMGLWHGSAIHFIYYGLILSFGISVNKLWQIELVNIIGKTRYKALCQCTWYSIFATSLSLAYFSLSLTFIWHDNNHPVATVALNLILYYICCFIFLCLAFALITTFGNLLTFFKNSFIKYKLPHNNYLLSTAAAIKILLLININMAVGTGVAEFIYEDF